MVIEEDRNDGCKHAIQIRVAHIVTYQSHKRGFIQYKSR